MVAVEKSWIEKAPGRMGGAACVRRTRFAVWLLVAYRQLGMSDSQQIEAYPGLTQEDLDAAWQYYAENPAEIHAAIRRNEEA